MGHSTGEIRGTITRKVDAVMDGLEQEFPAMYSKYDFYEEIKKVETDSMSDQQSELQVLYTMFRQCDVALDKDKDDLAYYKELVKNMDIPEDYRGVEQKLIYNLYEKYQEYPTPQEYLARIVKRLSRKEDHWASDTLRVKILKQFVKYGNCLTYKKNDGSKGEVKIYNGAPYIKKYLQNKTGMKISDLNAVVNEIEDDIFDILDQADDDQKKPGGTYGILKMVDDLAGGKFRVEGATKKSLYLFAMVYDMTFYSGDTENGERLDYNTDIEINLFRDFYSNNLMRFLSREYQDKPGAFERDPDGRGINYKNFAEMIYLYYISREEYSAEEKIRLSDEMIQRVQGKGKVKNAPESAYNKETEVYRRRVKNDYEDNIFSEDILKYSEPDFEQFLLDHYDCNTNKGGHIVAPINVQNEQNTAYAYYCDILEDLKDMRDKADPSRNRSLNAKYEVKEADKKGKKKNSSNLISPIDKDIDKTNAFGIKELNIGLNNLVDVISYEEKKKEAEKNGKEMKVVLCGHEIDPESYDRFMKFMETANEFMTEMTPRGKSMVTRTALLVVYYYYYIAKKSWENTGKYDDEDSYGKWKVRKKKESFEEVFDDFKGEVDEELESAYYQPLSSKNIFDVLVVLSIYATENV